MTVIGKIKRYVYFPHSRERGAELREAMTGDRIYYATVSATRGNQW